MTTTVDVGMTPRGERTMDFVCAGRETRDAWEDNAVSSLYFSATNVAALQHGLRYGVFARTGDVVGEQSEEELRAIMRSVYLAHGVNLPYGVVEQVRSLNARVLEFAVPRVADAVASFRGYLRDREAAPQLLQHAQNVSSKGDRSLRFA